MNVIKIYFICILVELVMEKILLYFFGIFNIGIGNYMVLSLNWN